MAKRQRPRKGVNYTAKREFLMLRDKIPGKLRMRLERLERRSAKAAGKIPSKLRVRLERLETQNWKLAEQIKRLRTQLTRR